MNLLHGCRATVAGSSGIKTTNTDYASHPVQGLGFMCRLVGGFGM